MTDVPKIVRNRLKAVPSVEHPDANLLTAFAESALLDRERVKVLDHLSHCADCREIVAVALPASEAVPPRLSPKRTSWLTWPAVRWGLVAAGVLAIASFGVVRYQHETRMQTAALKTAAIEAKNEAAVPPVSAPSADKSNAPSASVPNAPIAKHYERRDEPASPEIKAKPLTNPAMRLLVSTSPQSATQPPAPVKAGALANSSQPSRSKDLRVPAANETVEVSAQAVQAEIAQNQPSSAPALNVSEPAVAKSKNADTLQSASAGATIGGPVTSNVAVQLAAAPSKAAPARWTISSTGVLQRSFDQGQTWQEVNVADNASSFDAFAYRATTEARAMPAAKQSLKKGAASPASFRAVTSNGLNVWVGGSQGALYHSADSGNHWTRVVPMSSGVVLTGDVIALDFPDFEHGKVSTSSSEVWTTSDAGQTWQKQ